MLISALMDFKSRQMSFGKKTHHFQLFAFSMVQIPTWPTISLIRCPRTLEPIPNDSAYST